MAESQVALALTTGQLWAASVILVGVVGSLIAYIYVTTQTRNDQRFAGLNNKIKDEVAEIKKDFNDKIQAQNDQLTHVISAIEASSRNLQQLYHDLDKRLYAHEVVVKGKIHATIHTDR